MAQWKDAQGRTWFEDENGQTYQIPSTPAPASTIKPVGGFSNEQGGGAWGIRPELGPSNDYYAINPATGQKERIYQRGIVGYGEGGSLPSMEYFFESDYPKDVGNAATRLTASPQGSSLLEPLVIGGLSAIAGAGLASALGGTGGAATGAYGGAGDFAAGMSGLGGVSGGVADAALVAGGAGGAAAGTGVGSEFAGLPDMLGGIAEANAGLSSAFTGAAGGTVAAPEAFAQDWSLPSTPAGSSMGFDAASVAAPAVGAAGSGVLPTAAGVGAGTTAAIAGGAAAAPSLYDRLTGGNAQNADYLELLGRVAPAALGAFASNQQANSLENIANKYAEYGAPSRARYEGSFAPGFTMASDPGYQDALDQSASAAWRAGSMGGNPAGNPAALSEILDRLYKGTAYPALQNYRTGNASAGGIASGTAAAPSLDQSAIGARTNVYNAFGAGIADVMNKPKSLAEQFSDLRRMGIV